MRLWRLIQPSITASAFAHLLLLGLVILFSEVHPFGNVTAQPIKVDLVTPDEVPKAPDENKPDPQPTKPDLQPDLQIPKLDVTEAQPSAAQPQSAPPSAAPEKPQQQQSQQPQQRAARPDQRQAAAQPQQQPQKPPQQQQQLAAATPPPTMPVAPPPQQQRAYTQPEPDLTVKYNVMLGLPEALPPTGSPDDRPNDGGDGNAASAANLSSSLIAEFRAHLKTCSKLPAAVARSDNVFVKLRVIMTPQAQLAAEPVLIEGTASMKGVELKQSAVQALTACQPYTMLPPDRYGEWKVLDLSFAPGDFS